MYNYTTKDIPVSVKQGGIISVTIVHYAVAGNKNTTAECCHVQKQPTRVLTNSPHMGCDARLS